MGKRWSWRERGDSGVSIPLLSFLFLESTRVAGLETEGGQGTGLKISLAADLT
jgi:hypothetical protein